MYFAKLEYLICQYFLTRTGDQMLKNKFWDLAASKIEIMFIWKKCINNKGYVTEATIIIITLTFQHEQGFKQIVNKREKSKMLDTKLKKKRFCQGTGNYTLKKMCKLGFKSEMVL